MTNKNFLDLKGITNLQKKRKLLSWLLGITVLLKVRDIKMVVKQNVRIIYMLDEQLKNYVIGCAIIVYLVKINIIYLYDNNT